MEVVGAGGNNEAQVPPAQQAQQGPLAEVPPAQVEQVPQAEVPQAEVPPAQQAQVEQVQQEEQVPQAEIPPAQQAQPAGEQVPPAQQEEEQQAQVQPVQQEEQEPLRLLPPPGLAQGQQRQRVNSVDSNATFLSVDEIVPPGGAIDPVRLNVPLGHITNPPPMVQFTKQKIEPEDFFKDFRVLLERNWLQFTTQIEKEEASSTRHITQQLEDIETDIVRGINHMTEILVSGLLDAQQIVNPPDEFSYELINKCMYIGNQNFFRYMYGTLTNVFDVDQNDVAYFNCNEHCDFRHAIDQDPEKHKCYLIEACVHHHYQIENINYMTKMFTTKYMATNENGESIPMFYYALKRGL